MKQKLVSITIFISIITFYGFLYLACSVDKPCTDECEKFINISNKLSKDSLVYGVYQCNTGDFCINVKDSLPRPWNGLADTACNYLKEEGLLHYNIIIYGSFSQDTLVKQTCP